MFKLVRNPDPRKKPPYGSRLDPTHPLSQGLVGCWLFNEGGGNVCNNLLNPMGGVLDGGSWDRYGVHVAGTNRLYDTTPDLSGVDSVAFSFTSDGSTSNDQAKYIIVDDSLFQIQRYNNVEIRLVINYPDIDVRWGLDRNMHDERTHIISISWDVSGKEILYQDGINQGDYTDSGSFPSLYDTIYFLNRADGARYANGSIGFAFFYNRYLSEGEHLALNAEPYAHILVPQYWHMVDFISTGGEEKAIMNQFQKSNLGADLFNGSLL